MTTNAITRASYLARNATARAKPAVMSSWTSSVEVHRIRRRDAHNTPKMNGASLMPTVP